MKLDFIPIDYSTFDFEGRNFLKIVGRSGSGKRVCVVDEHKANFWGILKDGLSEKKIKSVVEKLKSINVEKAGRKTRVLDVEVCDKKFLGRDVKAVRVFVSNHKDSHLVTTEMNEMVGEEVVHRREKDLNVVTKYIMEDGMEPLCWYCVEGEEISGSDDFGGVGGIDVDVCVKVGKVKKLDREGFEPRILAYDIEADDLELGKGSVLMISLYGKGFKKVLTWKKCKKAQDYVECFPGEAEMLEAFVKYVKEYAPDLLVGYFSDGFDLPYLKASARQNGVCLSLGLDGSQPTFKRGFIPAGRIDGIVHVDLLRFIQTAYAQYLKSETLSLNEVAGELLGSNKDDFDFARLAKMSESDWRDFFKYNLKDSELTYGLAEKLWPDMFELVRTVKEPLFNVNRYGLSGIVENYIVHNLKKFNEIAEKRPMHKEIGARRARGQVEGAFVFQPEAGLYENLAMFDFTSMHTSIIISFNLSATTYLEKKEKGCFVSPEVEIDGKKRKLYFSKERGFIPELLEDIFKKRKAVKAEYKKNPTPITKARSNVFKLMSASVHGYQGFYGARYYSHEAAAATLAFVRKFNKDAISSVEKAGYKVVYADTDSVAFEVGERSKSEVKDFLKKLNKDLPEIMEMELEDFYKRGLWVTKRDGSFGAKKKYALLGEKGKLKIRGFVTVRRDWCRLARDLQNKVIQKVLEDGNEKGALKLVKETVDNLKKKKVELDDLVIRTQLKKPIGEYVAKGPHVIAAKRMVAAGIPVSVGMLIEYYVAEGSGKRIGDRVKLPNEKGGYDVDYYLKNQIGAAVENILEVFGVGFQEVVDGERQVGLF